MHKVICFVWFEVAELVAWQPAQAWELPSLVTKKLCMYVLMEKLMSSIHLLPSLSVNASV